MSKKNRVKKEKKEPIEYRNKIERQIAIRPILEKLSELQLTSHYDSVKNLFLIFKEFIENGGSHNINIPFPEINKRFVGIITDNKKYENMVKLESLK